MLAGIGVSVALLETVPVPALLVSRLELLAGTLTVALTLGWLRASRTALDLEDWCRCAAATMTMHEIVAKPLGSGAPPPTIQQRSRRRRRVGRVRR
jgi:hypothetical protein